MPAILDREVSEDYYICCEKGYPLDPITAWPPGAELSRLLVVIRSSWTDESGNTVPSDDAVTMAEILLQVIGELMLGRAWVSVRQR